MVNFRYHLASLVAVFLALAVGVVLGAGPLQQNIDAASQGKNMAKQARELEGQLADARQTQGEQANFIQAAGKEILPGALQGKKVVVVTLPGSQGNAVDTINESLEDANAEIIGTVELTDAWVAQGQKEYRDTLSGPLASHLQNQDGGPTADEVLARGLVDILTSTGPEQDLVRDMLTDAQMPLVQPDSLPGEPAQMMVVVGPGDVVSQSAGAEAPQSDGVGTSSSTALVALGKAATAVPQGAAVVGEAETDNDFISLIRQAQIPVTTVDQIGTQMSGLNTALALASQKVGAYGQGIGATSQVAPMPQG